MKIRSFIKLCAKIYKTKAAKVALLGVCSTMLLVSSGVSFAKYYSENGFGDGASAAKFDCGNIFYDDYYKKIQTPSEMVPGSDDGMYAFLGTFRLELGNVEVKSIFSLSLRMSTLTNSSYTDSVDEDGNSTFPSNTFFSFVDSSQKTTVDGEVINNKYTSTISTFNTTTNSKGDEVIQKINAPFSTWIGESDVLYNTFYYADSVDGVNYNWHKVDSDNKYIVNLEKDKTFVNNTNIYYKFLYFVSVTALNFENSKVLFDFSVEQVSE